MLCLCPPPHFTPFSPGNRRLHAWRLEVSGPGFSGHAFSLLPTRGGSVARAPWALCVRREDLLCLRITFFMPAFRPRCVSRGRSVAVPAPGPPLALALGLSGGVTVQAALTWPRLSLLLEGCPQARLLHFPGGADGSR